VRVHEPPELATGVDDDVLTDVPDVPVDVEDAEEPVLDEVPEDAAA